jgi:hypothetical protein
MYEIPITNIVKEIKSAILVLFIFLLSIDLIPLSIFLTNRPYPPANLNKIFVARSFGEILATPYPDSLTC